MAVSGSGALFATASNDESILVWSTEQVLQSKSQVVATLDEHEHQIDCIAWAPLEAARTIEHSEYAGATSKHPPSDHNHDPTQYNKDTADKKEDDDEEDSHDK